MSDNNNQENRQKDGWNGNTGLYGTTGAKYASHAMPLWFIKSRITTNYILGVLEVLLLFRFIFKLLGANPGSGFVSFVYSLTGIFIAPFSGIFNSFVTGGLVAKSIFEPAVIIAMLVYAVAAWGVVNLLRLKAQRNE